MNSNEMIRTTKLKGLHMYHNRFVSCIGALALASASIAGTPLGTGFTYQGQLKQSGSPFTGSASMTFSLYDAGVGGAFWGAQTVPGVSINGGLFTVMLNDSGQFGASAFSGERRWLEISVNGATLTPRQEITAGPYALFTPASNGGGGLTLPYSGIANAANTTAFSIFNTAITGNSYGIAGSSSSPTGIGVYGNALAAGGPAAGVQGFSASSAGFGVYGGASSPTGLCYGVYGVTGSAESVAVRGYNSGTTGPAYAGSFRTDSTEGIAISSLASATSGTSTSVYAENMSPQGIAIHGYASASPVWAPFSSIGVKGESASPTGIGVLGTSCHFGVYGTSQGFVPSNETGIQSGGSCFNIGVYGGSFGTGVCGEGSTGGYFFGHSIGVFTFADPDLPDGEGIVAGGRAYGGEFFSAGPGGTAVYALAGAQTGTNYGVFAKTDSADGWAGYFVGRVNITGTLSKGAGSFKIDHPLDPENKYLYHSFVESPDMKNIYDGVVTTDDQGDATVTLPDWFEALNRDYRYQLTVIGQFAQAIVAEEIHKNHFRIQTNKPHVKVSWQVTGIRQDDFANAHRIPVEENKTTEERGKYLYPQEHGQPIERGADYRLKQHHKPNASMRPPRQANSGKDRADQSATGYANPSTDAQAKNK